MGPHQVRGRLEGVVRSAVRHFHEAFTLGMIDLSESEDQTIARFVNGLKWFIQDQLSLHHIKLDEAYRMTLRIEKQQHRINSQKTDSSKLKSSIGGKSFKNPSSPSSSYNSIKPSPTEPNRVDKGNGIMGSKPIGPYYKCGLYGHLSATCKKNNPPQAHCIEQNEEEGEESEDEENEGENEPIDVEGDEGDHYLVIHRIDLIASSQCRFIFLLF